MLFPIIALLDGPVFWAIAAIMCLISLPTAVIVAVVMLKKNSAQAPLASSAPPAPGSRLYQFARKGSVVGTFAEGVVRDLVASGQIKPDDDYWTEGMPNWQKVSDNPAWF
jgi:hypothetical protein